MYDHWTSLATPYRPANNSSPNQHVWISSPDRRASASRQRPLLARSLSAISNERGQHGSFSCSVSRPQTPPSRPPSPFPSAKRMREPLRFLLPTSHPSTGSTSKAPISSKVIITTSVNRANQPLRTPKTAELVDADSQPSCAVPFLEAIRFDQLKTSSADNSQLIKCFGQSATNKIHKEWCHALSCPCSPPGSRWEELCIVPDYEDHTPKIEIFEPLESVCDSSSSCCSEENYQISSAPLLIDVLRPFTPQQQKVYNSELPLRDTASIHSLVDLPKLPAGPGWLAQGKDCETWVEETLKASRELNFSRPRKVKPQRTFGVAEAPQLCINMDENTAEKESLHYATVVTPTKPRIVTIPRHNSSAGTSPTASSHCHAPSIGSAFDFDICMPAGSISRTCLKQNALRDGVTKTVRGKGSLNTTHMQRSVLAVSCLSSNVTSIHSFSSSTSEVKHATLSAPQTPPQTPHRGRRRNRSNTAPVKATMIDHDKASAAATREDHLMTPPQSPLTCSSKKPLSKRTFPKRLYSSTTRRPTRLVTSASDPSHFVSNIMDLSWILSEIEAAITVFPGAMLQLDSAVIQHLRSCRRPSTSYKTETARVSRRPSLKSPPHRRHSPIQPSMMSSPHLGRAHPNDSPTVASHNPLRAIFPGAPAHLLNALQANTIALNYICEKTAAILSPISASSLAKARRTSAVYRVSRSPRRFGGPLDLAGIAPKARRMLGFPRRSQVSLSAAVPDTESQPGEQEKKPEEPTSAEHGMRERGEKVRDELMDMSRWLVEEIGRRTDDWGSEGRASTLVLALGELVKLGDKARG